VTTETDLPTFESKDKKPQLENSVIQQEKLFKASIVITQVEQNESSLPPFRPRSPRNTVS
jgi:hypothetical protein